MAQSQAQGPAQGQDAVSPPQEAPCASAPGKCAARTRLPSRKILFSCNVCRQLTVSRCQHLRVHLTFQVRLAVPGSQARAELGEVSGLGHFCSALSAASFAPRPPAGLAETSLGLRRHSGGYSASLPVRFFVHKQPPALPPLWHELHLSRCPGRPGQHGARGHEGAGK